MRRALGDPSVYQVAPHITLVAPVNVRTEALADALGVLRKAASGQEGRLRFELGPVASFEPVNPVLYLAVRGEGPGAMADLARLHQAALAGPLERPERWPWA
ncbi:MAG: 2'-5' RNA ligase family protein, partial [Acidimicrobiales bacterium]